MGKLAKKKGMCGHKAKKPKGFKCGGKVHKKGRK